MADNQMRRQLCTYICLSFPVYLYYPPLIPGDSHGAVWFISPGPSPSYASDNSPLPTPPSPTLIAPSSVGQIRQPYATITWKNMKMTVRHLYLSLRALVVIVERAA